MNDLKERLDREADTLVPSRDSYQSMLDKVRHRDRRRRLVAGGVALALAAGGGLGLWASFRPSRPAIRHGFVTEPGPVRSNGPIVFVAHGTDRRVEILRVGPEGTALTVLVGDREAYTSSSSVSPGGTLVAYMPRASSAIRVVGIDGSHDRQLVSEAQEAQGYTSATQIDGWSPDGTRLLFERNQDIYVVDVMTKIVTRLTGTPHPLQIVMDNIGSPIVRPAADEEGSASWSPDGRTIAFVRGGSLFVMRPDGSGAHLLVRFPDRIVERPAWSPDDSALAFSTLQLGGTYPVYCDRQGGGVFVVRANGSGLTRLTDMACDSSAAWSPGGDRLLFSTGGSVDMIRLDGSGRVTIAENAEMPVWSPDGRRVAYLGLRHDDLFLANADGSGRVQVRTPGYVVEQAPVVWAPATG